MVQKVYGLIYTVQYNDKLVNCVLRGKIRLDKDLFRYSNPVAVGDIVNFDFCDDGTGVINEIEERRNIFSRKEKGKNKKEDIIAANLDYIVVIQSFANPEFNLRFVDRLLVRGEKEGIPVALCANKIDLATKESIRFLSDYYKNANIDLCMVSALTGKGMKQLKKMIKNNITLFVGRSGVGKTSILNYLYPGLDLRTSEVSAKKGKGRHTTSNVEMIIRPDGTGIIDTPGVREFGLMDIEPDTLGQYFNEFAKYIDKCEFNPCTHDHEPNCEVKRQVEKGNIFEERYISYINILYSLKEYYDRMYN